MKKIYLALVMLMAGVSAQAQRQCDLEMTAGVSGTVNIDAAGTTPTYFDFKIKNNGPDDLAITDTVIFQSLNFSYVNGFYGLAVPAGGTVSLKDTMFFGTGPDSGPATLCDSILILLSSTADPAVDLNVANDKLCETVTVVNSGTAISDVFTTVSKTKREQLAIFPNPATQTVKFDFTAKNSSEVVAQVYDVTGRLVLSNNYGKAFNGQTNYSLNIANLTNGMYFVELRQDGVRAVGKLNKQ